MIKTRISKTTTFHPTFLPENSNLIQSYSYTPHIGVSKNKWFIWSLVSRSHCSILPAATPRYCSDLTGFHYLELHISTDRGSHSSSKSAVTSFSLPIHSFLPRPHIARRAVQVTSRYQFSWGQNRSPLIFGPIAESLYLCPTLYISS